MKCLYWFHSDLDNSFIGKILKRFKVYQRIKDRLFEEHKWMCGFRNKDKIFYIIRPFGATQGLMSIHNYVLWKIRYAVEHNYIPVVDMKNYSNMYLEPDLGGKNNSWEYYFQQPMGYKVEDALRSKNVIMCDLHLEAGYGGIEDVEETLLFHEIIQKYCRLNDIMSEEVERLSSLIFPKGKQVIGVLGRGTDYSSLHPYGHAVVPNAEQLIKIIDKKMEEWGGDYVFVATEDKNIFEALNRRYGKKLLSLDVPRFEHDTENKRLAQLSFQRENDRYLRGKEYLLTIYLLAQCDSIITSQVAGGLAALRINGGKYSHKYIFHLGRYE